jgi:predicted DsbA family dithiol-disulfide isomerase
MMQQVADTAARDGLELDLLNARSGNTFDAHRVIHLAADRGVQSAVKERLLRGYMTERQAIGDRDVLIRLASEAGLDAEEVRAMLASDRFAREVREDEDIARKLGISGVPFFVLGGAIGVSGAQPVEVMLQALDQAWANAQESAGPREGEACGTDGCA